MSANKSIWLSAWSNPVASLSTFQSCMAMVDVRGDSDHSLAVADVLLRRVKLFHGTQMVWTHQLPAMPSAVHAFRHAVEVPESLAVAAGDSVYEFRGVGNTFVSAATPAMLGEASVPTPLRPHFKFVVPKLPIATAEAEVWCGVAKGTVDAADAYTALTELRADMLDAADAKVDAIGVKAELSERSRRLLSIESVSERKSFVERMRYLSLPNSDTVVCLGSVEADVKVGDSRVASCLLVGTESGAVYLLDTPGHVIKQKMRVPSAPVAMATIGSLAVEWRLAVACRDGCVYQFRGGLLLGTVIRPAGLPLQVELFPKTVLVACMNRKIAAYSFKGTEKYLVDITRKWNSTPLKEVDLSPPPHILCMLSLMSPSQARNEALYAVALSNGSLRVYADKTLIEESVWTPRMDTEESDISESKYSDATSANSAVAMCFGKYGRSDSSLAMVARSGALHIKVMRRTADLSAKYSKQKQGPPPRQNIPIDIPPVTKLCIDQIARERARASRMHKVFQRDLASLRVYAAREYLRVLQSGEMTLRAGGDGSAISKLQLESASVTGLGPEFLLQLRFTTSEAETAAVRGLRVMLAYDNTLYDVQPAVQTLPTVLPGRTATVSVKIKCTPACVEHGVAGNVRFHVLPSPICSSEGITTTAPLLSTIVELPASESPQEN